VRVLGQLANVAVLVLMPFVLVGTITRVKSLWSGRKGPPILQPAFDVLRLMRKTSVYSDTTTAVFRMAPYVLLATSVAGAVITPLLGGTPLVSFHFDYVWFAYSWALGRVGLMLASLDTGSSFEGMGAAREATFSALLEPVLFLSLGTLSLLSRSDSLHQALAPRLADGPAIAAWVAVVVALTIALQVETGRMPVDDPTTHLELTMVHEVMVLDHSGPDLAAIQVGSAVKFLVGSAIVATLLNPWRGLDSPVAALANVAFELLIAVVVGTIESLIARLKLRAIPHYIAAATLAGVVALLAAAWRAGGVG
jgi:formate hydrogenlyase subunit 4